MTLSVTNTKYKLSASAKKFDGHAEIALPRYTVAGIFLLLIGIYALVIFGLGETGMIVAIATVTGGYMAINIGANDVANAVGPLSAIVSVANSTVVASEVGIPLWVMVIGAIGISFGLFLFGAKLIRKVGKQLTALDQTRAFCVCLSAAITVISASALGLPVSSTHIAIGSIFGIGFYREFCSNSEYRSGIGFSDHIDRIINRILRGESERGGVKARRKPRRLVRRRQLLTIVAAWFITVPSAAAMSAGLFFLAQAIVK